MHGGLHERDDRGDERVKILKIIATVFLMVSFPIWGPLLLLFGLVTGLYKELYDALWGRRWGP
jgi:hypothetical protein